jgi:hypothetical protein
MVTVNMEALVLIIHSVGVYSLTYLQFGDYDLRVIPCEVIQVGRSTTFKKIIFCTLTSTYFHTSKIFLTNSNPLGSSGTAVFIMRKKRAFGWNGGLHYLLYHDNYLSQRLQ